MELNPSLLEIWILIAVSVLVALVTANRRKLRKWLEEWRKKRRGPRQLHPQSPEACPRCSADVFWFLDRPRKAVVPWRERKSRAGRPKTIDTSGYACGNRVLFKN